MKHPPLPLRLSCLKALVSVTPCFRPIAVGLGGLALTAGGVAQPPEVSSQISPAREHHLFVGAELLLRQNDELVPVKRIKGDQARLADPVDDYVPLRRSGGIIWRLTTKVAPFSGAIEDLKLRQSSSAARAAFADQARLQAVMDDQTDRIVQSQGALLGQEAQLNALTNSPDPNIRQAAEAQLSEIQTEMAALQTDLTSMNNILDSSLLGDSALTGDGENQADTLELSFLVSTEIDLPEAYVFVALRVWVNDSFHDTSFYRHLSNLGPKPRKITLVRPGFPPGFAVKDTEIYLFSYGEEIPTNLSEKHFPLSYEEARAFVQLAHQGEHRRSTVPAEPAWSLVPPGLIGARDLSSLDYPITVELDEFGSIRSIPESAQIVPNHVRELVQQLTFLPALENGNPVASTLTVNLTDFYKD